MSGEVVTFGVVAMLGPWVELLTKVSAEGRARAEEQPCLSGWPGIVRLNSSEMGAY